MDIIKMFSQLLIKNNISWRVFASFESTFKAGFVGLLGYLEMKNLVLMIIGWLNYALFFTNWERGKRINKPFIVSIVKTKLTQPKMLFSEYKKDSFLPNFN